MLVRALYLSLCTRPVESLFTNALTWFRTRRFFLVSTNTLEGRLAVFDEVWETIQQRYYDPALNGIDWQAKRNAFRPVAAKAGSAYELYDVLRQMIGSLKDAHTRVYSPDEKFDWWNPRYVTVGLTVREIEGSRRNPGRAWFRRRSKTRFVPAMRSSASTVFRSVSSFHIDCRTSGRGWMLQHDLEPLPWPSTDKRERM